MSLAPVSVTATGALAGVQLPVPSASLVMHRLLLETVANFPDVFGGVDIPIDPRAFAQQYAAVLTAFEVARASSPGRVAIAQFVTDEIQRSFPFVNPRGVASSLEEAMGRAALPLPTTTLEYPYAHSQSGDGYRLSVPYRGRVYGTQVELLALADRLERENVMQKEAAQAFRWTVRYAFAEGRDGVIRLKGERFALLGGDAELSPLRALLDAGAEVFTTHLSPGWINRFVEEAGEFGGRLVYATQGANLLTQTPEITATIERFAGKRPVHLGTFAYAGGQGREWRLGAAMDAVVRRLGDRVRSVTSWRTPSIVAEVSPEMARVADGGFQSRTVWQRFLHRISGGRLFSPNITAAGDRFFAQSVVPLQGPSYAGMNLFGKVYGAEVLGEKVTVSASVAPITATHSMDTPAMRAGFREAENFDIYVADPAFTRAVTFLLMVHDLFDPSAAASVVKGALGEAGASALFRQQVHGGVFTSPFQLGGLLTYATVAGNAKRWLNWFNPFRRSDAPEIAEKAAAESGTTIWVAPSSPAAFEKAVRQLKGPLAGAIAGASQMTPARAMFLGHTNVVPRGGNRLFAIVSWANRYLPWLAGAVRRIARQEVYGSLLTTLLFKERGRDDQIVLTVDPSGLLRSVRLRRTSRQDLEFRLGEGPIKRVEQIVHYGRQLADGTSHLSLGYAYDEADGILKSLGSTQVNRDFRQLGPFSIGSSPIPLAHWGTFADLTQQSPVGSLTFLPNAGILREALRFLRDPSLAVDFSRVTIQGLEFQRGGVAVAFREGGSLDTVIQPVGLVQTDKGELLKAALVQSRGGKEGGDYEEVQRTIVSILVRGNHPRPPQPGGRLERVVDRRLAEVAGGRNISVRLMGDRALVDFAVLSGDSNPLHQIDGVARVVGFRRRISPGFGTLAQIEAAVRALFDVAIPQATLSRLTGTLVRPGYPGETYQLECAPEVGTPRRYRYQLVQTGRARKVLVDGLFEIG